MSLWDHFWPQRRIGTRIVLGVTIATFVVQALAGAFVYWRVQYALDRQLDQDLRGFRETATSAAASGQPLPSDTPGLVAQLVAHDGRLLASSDSSVSALATKAQLAAAGPNDPLGSYDRGHLLPASEHPRRFTVGAVATPQGDEVLVTSISRAKRDEALRELLLQLTIADALGLVAAAFVGYGVSRAALAPVERYRRAAATGEPSHRLPVSTARDDELTRLGSTFNTLLDRIEESQQRERQFLADASHELRTPLAAMAAEIEWARSRRRSEEEMTQTLASLGDQVDQLVDLSNTLLDLEEMRSGSAMPGPMPLDDVVAQVVGTQQAAAAALDREIVWSAPDVMISADRSWVELALRNLVLNALRHGAGRVTVTAEAHDGRARFLVHDEGPGLPDGFDGHAFDRFTRGDAGRSGGGRGLGLALVQAAAAAHGGAAEAGPEGIGFWLPGDAELS